MGVIENAIDKLRRERSAAGTAAPAGFAAAASAATPDRPRRAGQTLAVDRARLREAGYLCELGQEHRFAEDYESLKRAIIRRATASGASQAQRIIMITSAVPGDGKTFTSINLALSIAREKDLSVLLVDADFIRAQVGQVFGVRDAPGLLDAVADPLLDVESLVLGTSVPGLELLPGGVSHAAEAAELVSSSRAEAVVERLLSSVPGRLVLLDAAPLLAAANARALVHVPGQVLLVARSRHTPMHALREAAGLLERGKLHGVVVNDALQINKGAYYGRGYGYGYGSPEQGSGGADSQGS